MAINQIQECEHILSKKKKKWKELNIIDDRSILKHRQTCFIRWENVFSLLLLPMCFVSFGLESLKKYEMIQLLYQKLRGHRPEQQVVL